jgi:hypothetical protein
MSDEQRRIAQPERLVADQQELIGKQREYIDQQDRLIERQGRELRRRGKANPAQSEGPGLMMWMKQPRRPGTKSKIDLQATLRLRQRLIAYQKAKGYRSLEKATEKWFLEMFAPETRKKKDRVRAVARLIWKRVGNLKRLIDKE